MTLKRDCISVDPARIDALVHLNGRLLVMSDEGAISNYWELPNSSRISLGDTIQIGNVEDVMVVTGFVGGKGVTVSALKLLTTKGVL